MVGLSFTPATLIAVFAFLIQYLVSDAVQYAATNGIIVLDPKIPGRLLGILWKHKGDKVLEWESPSDLTVYREFKDIAQLNTTTGELTIRGMTSRFSGEYVAECTINGTRNQHVIRENVEVIDPVSALDVGCEKNGTVITLTCNATGPMTEYLLSGPGQEGAPWSKQPIVVSFDATTDLASYTCSSKNPVSKTSRVFESNSCDSHSGDESLKAVAIVVPVLLVFVGIVVVGVISGCYCKKRGRCGNSRDVERDETSKIQNDDNNASLNDPLLKSNTVQRNNSGDMEYCEMGDVQRNSAPTIDPSTNIRHPESPDKAGQNTNNPGDEELQDQTPLQRNISVKETVASWDKRDSRTSRNATANDMETENHFERETPKNPNKVNPVKTEGRSEALDIQSNVTDQKVDSLIDKEIIANGEVPKLDALLETETKEGENASLIHQDPVPRPPPKPPRCPEKRRSDVIGQDHRDKLPAQEDWGKHEENQEVERTSPKGSEEEEDEASGKAGGRSEAEDNEEKKGMMRENVEAEKEEEGEKEEVEEEEGEDEEVEEEEQEDEEVEAEERKGDREEAADEEEGTEGGERDEGRARAEDEDHKANRNNDKGDGDDDDDDGKDTGTEGTPREPDYAGQQEGSEGGGSEGGGSEGGGSEGGGSEGGGSDGEDDGGEGGAGGENGRRDASQAMGREG